MALTTVYLLSTKNLGNILEAIKRAQAPQKFGSKFLKDLGFPSTSDTLIVGLFKALGFVTESGQPKDRYFEYIDESQSKAVLAKSIKEAYSDLFTVNSRASEMPVGQVKEKFKTLTRGSKGDSVLQKMAATFVAICKFADFSSSVITSQDNAEKEASIKSPPEKDARLEGDHARSVRLAYNINIELPSVRDQAVYDAIFRSLREHLL